MKRLKLQLIIIITVCLISQFFIQCSKASIPKNAIGYYNRGVDWLENKEYDKAIKDFTKAIELNPEYVSAYYNRGVTRGQNKEYDKAIKDFTKVIEFDPDSIRGYNNRGNAWYKKKEYDKAIKDYTKAIKLDPELMGAYYNRGLVWKQKKEYDKAIKDYTTAIEFGYKNGIVYCNRGHVWVMKKEYDKAIQDYIKAIKIDPDFVPALINFAWFLSTCSDSKYRNGKEAVEYALKAYKINSNSWHSSTLAAAYAETGDFNNAIKYQKEAIDKLKDKKQIKDYTSRLELYKKKKPYRDK